MDMTLDIVIYANCFIFEMLAPKGLQ